MIDTSAPLFSWLSTAYGQADIQFVRHDGRVKIVMTNRSNKGVTIVHFWTKDSCRSFSDSLMAAADQVWPTKT